MSNAADNLMSLDIVPVRCPVCGEAFEAAEYLQLSIERRAELDSASIDPKARAN